MMKRRKREKDRSSSDCWEMIWETESKPAVFQTHRLKGQRVCYLLIAVASAKKHVVNGHVSGT